MSLIVDMKRIDMSWWNEVVDMSRGRRTTIFGEVEGVVSFPRSVNY